MTECSDAGIDILQKNVDVMMGRRGFNLDEALTDQLRELDIFKTQRERRSEVYARTRKTKQRAIKYVVLVYYACAGSSSLKLESIRVYCRALSQMNFNKPNCDLLESHDHPAINTGEFAGIIVSPVGMSPQAKLAFEQLTTSRYRHQFFLDEALIYDPLISTYTPEVFPLSSEEIRDLTRQVQLSKLPRIASNDPIVEYYGFKPGTVLLFIRKTMIPGLLLDTEIFYRLVSRFKLKKTGSS